MARGRENLVQCDKCGRWVRRDKAVAYDKTIFSHPLERHEVQPGEAYMPRITRKVYYCASCARHGRIFEKKIQQLQRQQRREQEGERRGGAFGFRPRRRRRWEQRPPQPAQAPAQPAAQPAQPAQQEVKQEESPGSQSSGEGV